MTCWLIQIMLYASAQNCDRRNPMLHRKMVTELINPVSHAGNRHEVTTFGFLEKFVQDLNSIVSLFAWTDNAENFFRQK